MQTLSAHSSLYRKAEQTARCTGSTKATASQRRGTGIAPDFLRHTFLPLYADTGKALPDKEITEQTYFDSLASLQSQYGIKTMDVGQKAYPYNLLLSAWDSDRKIKKLQPSVDIHIRGGRFAMPTDKRLDTGHTLYYIPVKPLYVLMCSKGSRNKKVSQLLLSVFSYLHLKASVPFYTDNDCFIKWQYETLKDWIEEDTEEDNDENLYEMNEAFRYGSIIKNEICLDSHLSCFGKRLAEFKTIKKTDNDLVKMARGFYDLWCQYPTSNIFSHLIPHLTEDENDVLRMEQYISFVADLEGNLCESLIDMINNTFNECSQIDEPVTLTVFGKDGQQSEDSFDYEQRLFELMDDLSYQLNNLI